MYFPYKTMLSIEGNTCFSSVIEDEKSPKSHYQMNGNNNDRRSSKRLKNSIESYRQIIDRGGNVLKTQISSNATFV